MARQQCQRRYYWYCYDLGHCSNNQFQKDWGEKVSPITMTQLAGCIGKKGTAAFQYIKSQLDSVSIPWEVALDVFYTASVPIYAKLTKNLYPGIEQLPPDAQGALLSIVYNRGTSVLGASRTEMKNIKQWVTAQRLDKIAAEIRSMKRLWQDKKLSGLLKRRDTEAALVEHAHKFIHPEDYVMV